MRTVPLLASLSDGELAEIYAWPEGDSLRLNMLIGPSGNVTGDDGTSHSLTSSADRRLLRIIRKDADAVVVGASSVRAEGWFLPPQGTLVVLSKSGDLPWDSCPDSDRVVVCRSVERLLEWLGEHPGRNLCEGGLSTARALDHVMNFTHIALTSHLPADAALDLVTGHPELFTLVFTSNETPRSARGSEGFFLWRRAAALKN